MNAMRATYNVAVKGWAIVVFLAVIVVVVGGTVTWGDHLQHNYAIGLHHETLNREHDANLRQMQTDYSTCTKINETLAVIGSVVETAYKGTVTITPKQVAQLPKETRNLLVALEPLLSASSKSSGVTKAAVLAKIPAPQTCRKPPSS